MSVSAIEYKQLRRRTGDDDATLPDAEIDDLFAIAELEYPEATYGRSVVRLYAAMMRVNELLASSIEEVTYTQNSQSESLSDKRKGYADLLAKMQMQLDAEIQQSRPALRKGRSKRVPSKRRDTPHGH